MEQTTTRRPVKVAGYSHAIQDARKQLRRTEAENRQFVYDRLTPQAKISFAKHRRGESKRELARLGVK